jgi:hypothetical protein
VVSKGAVAVCAALLVMPLTASAQQSTSSEQKPASATTVIDWTYPQNNLTPRRHIRTRTSSAGRELIVEKRQAPGNDGKLRTVEETTVEVIRGGTRTTETAGLYGFDGEGRRQLIEATESTQVVRADGGSETVRDTFVSDLNGRLSLTSRLIEHARSSPDARQSDATLLKPGSDRALVEVARTHHVERQMDAGIVRSDTNQLVRDINGRWQPTEIRSGESRQLGPSRLLEEETLHRADDSGRMALREKTLTQRTAANGREETVTETYAPYDRSSLRPDGRLNLIQVIRTSTIASADGGRRIVEEVEQRSPVSQSEPLRVVQRTVTTVRQAAPDRWSIAREVFELDVNGRFVLTIRETEDRTGPPQP